MLYQSLALAVTCLASLVSSLATFTPPISNGPSYSVGIPSGSTISGTAKGDLYFSISAPTSYQWVGLGIGQGMAGATIFIMYADGNGNVTISGRNGGPGHVEPQVDSTINLQLLEGSGISGGIMRANVLCTTCTLDSTVSSSSAPWISAWNEGDAANSPSTSYTIVQHSPNSCAPFHFDLTQAALTTNGNPFVTAASSSSGNSTDVNPGGPVSNSTGSNSGASVMGPSEATINNYDKAHGIVMGLVVVILFPLGSIFIRVVGHPWIHAGIQLLSLAGMIVGLGLGVKLAQDTDQVFTTGASTHTIFGVTIIILFLIQPFLGLIHHNLFQRTQSRSQVSHIHIWYGRALMILAVVNGGLGLQLADNTTGGEIVYGVLAGVMSIVYIGAVMLKRKSKGFGGKGFGGREKVAAREGEGGEL